MIVETSSPQQYHSDTGPQSRISLWGTSEAVLSLSFHFRVVMHPRKKIAGSSEENESSLSAAKFDSLDSLPWTSDFPSSSEPSRWKELLVVVEEGLWPIVGLLSGLEALDALDDCRYPSNRISGVNTFRNFIDA